MKLIIFLIIFIILIVMIVSYMVINKKSHKDFSFSEKYKENSIKITKDGFNDSRYIYGFKFVKGNEISLLKEYKISDNLIKLYENLKEGKKIEIDELGVGFDKDKEIKKVYYLEKDKKHGFGVKSDGKNIVYSKYEYKNELRNDLNKFLFNEDDTNRILNILLVKPDVKYYLKSDFLNKYDNLLTNSVHIAYYDRIQDVKNSKHILDQLCNQFDLPNIKDEWYEKNKDSLIDYIAFTKNLKNEIEITIYYTQKKDQKIN